MVRVVLALPGAEALDGLELVRARGPLDPVGARAASDELDELAVLGDRVGAPIGDVREDGTPDGGKAALDVAQHLDQRLVRAALREDLVELVVVPDGVPGIPPLTLPCHPAGGSPRRAG